MPYYKNKLGQLYKANHKSKYRPHYGKKQEEKQLMYGTVGISCGREVMNTLSKKAAKERLEDILGAETKEL